MGNTGRIRLSSAKVCTMAILLVCLLVSSTQGSDVEKGRVDVANLFVPSGWMGDGEYSHQYITFSGASNENPHSPPTCIKISYVFGPAKWGGIYWQNRPDNWGDERGSNYSGKGLTRITFWARGEKGGEVVEFKAGGIRAPRKPYSDSFEASTGRITLETGWRRYVMSLEHQNLASVIGGFCWVASKDYNADKKITFFLDDIFFE